MQVDSEGLELVGHSSHVTALEFLDTSEQTKLVSVGGGEASIMQWAL